MKRALLLFAIIGLLSTISIAQNKKAEKEAAAKAQFDKAAAAIEAKDFVIIVDTYEAGDRTIQTNTDIANFISYEKDYVFMQGGILVGSATHKMNVSEYKQSADKKGNIKIEMQVKGSLITAKIEIFMKNGGNYADVIVSPSKGGSKRFSGEVVPRAESKYFRRPGEV